MQTQCFYESCFEDETAFRGSSNSFAAKTYCLFLYDYMTEINTNYARADQFWINRHFKQFYKVIQENRSRPSCFDFECIKSLENLYRSASSMQLL